MKWDQITHPLFGGGRDPPVHDLPPHSVGQQLSPESQSAFESHSIGPACTHTIAGSTTGHWGLRHVVPPQSVGQQFTPDEQSASDWHSKLGRLRIQTASLFTAGQVGDSGLRHCLPPQNVGQQVCPRAHCLSVLHSNGGRATLQSILLSTGAHLLLTL